MARIFTSRKLMLLISFILFCITILLILPVHIDIGLHRRHHHHGTNNNNATSSRLHSESIKNCPPRVKIKRTAAENETYWKNHWKKEQHFNIDDYGVPVEEFMLSVSTLMAMPVKERVKKLKERDIKTVLYYHSAYGTKTYGFNYNEAHKQGQLPYIMKNCKRSDCFCTHQRDLIPLEEFDAIVFYSRGLSFGDLPRVRKPNQRYILWEVESPAYLLNFSPRSWANFFNWTHTLRQDSEFWEPWGMMNQITPFPKDVDTMISDRKKETGIASKKTLAVAWFVSNCNSRSGREAYIRELQKYIKVDIYGQCGPLTCSRSRSGECWENVNKNYYFYFSGENSLCRDYVTEKFFNALKYNVIPITMGGGDGTNDYSFAPKRSHIHVFDYASPEKLATYLKYLQSNPAEYESYFWWKPYYSIWLGRWKKAHCEICDMLHENDKVKVYPDMYDWWVTQGKCRSRWTG